MLKTYQTYVENYAKAKFHPSFIGPRVTASSEEEAIVIAQKRAPSRVVSAEQTAEPMCSCIHASGDDPLCLVCNAVSRQTTK